MLRRPLTAGTRAATIKGEKANEGGGGMLVDGVYSSERVSTEYLCLNSCGEQWVSYDTENLRPKGRADYAIQYISRGVGYCEAAGETRAVPAGSLMLFFPGVRQHYSFRRENKTLLLWTHFSGTAAALLEPLKSPGPVIIPLRRPEEFEALFHKMLAAHHLQGPYQQKMGEGYLLLLLAVVMQSTCPPVASVRPETHAGLLQVLDAMHLDFQRPIDLERYAALCFVTRNRFEHLFKEYTGVSPYHYKLRIRLDRAAEMLADSPVSVSECALAVGFRDCSYFCRIFKKYMGRTPLSYKKNGGRNEGVYEK